MPKKTRKRFTPQEKLAILRLHLLEHTPAFRPQRFEKGRIGLVGCGHICRSLDQMQAERARCGGRRLGQVGRVRIEAHAEERIRLPTAIGQTGEEAGHGAHAFPSTAASRAMRV